MKQAGWTYMENDRETRLVTRDTHLASLVLPKSCTSCPLRKDSDDDLFAGDLHWVYVVRSNGELRYIPWHRSHQLPPGDVFVGTTNSDGTLNEDLIFPLKRGSWGGIVGSIIPNQATKYVQLWNSGEYGIPWEVPSDSLATGGLFRCQCALDSEDQKNLIAVAHELDMG